MSRSGVHLRVGKALEAAHHELTRERTVDVALEAPDHLLSGDGNAVAGVDTVVGVLDSALRLPTTLTLRVSLPAGAVLSASEVAAFSGYCRAQADAAWFEAATLRSGGVRALPRALLSSLAAAALGVVSGYFAQSTDHSLLMVLLYAVGFMSVIAAWTIGWAPIEQTMFDWRAPAHTAAAYELLSHARLEVVQRPQGTG